MAGDSGKGYAAVYLFGLLNGNVFPYKPNPSRIEVSVCHHVFFVAETAEEIQVFNVS